MNLGASVASTSGDVTFHRALALVDDVSVEVAGATITAMGSKRGALHRVARSERSEPAALTEAHGAE